MHGKTTLKILKIISETAVITADVITAVLSSGYGASVSQLTSTLREIEKKRARREIETREIQNLYSRISHLKRDGLIKENKTKAKKYLALTLKGKEKLFKLTQRIEKQMPSLDYPKEKHDRLTIVIFDIPEQEKHKRNWLRKALRELGFKMVQKSVWMGNVKIPEEFLDDLLRLKILNFVEIFEATKTGSLKRD